MSGTSTQGSFRIVFSLQEGAPEYLESEFFAQDFLYARDIHLRDPEDWMKEVVTLQEILEVLRQEGPAHPETDGVYEVVGRVQIRTHIRFSPPEASGEVECEAEYRDLQWAVLPPGLCKELGLPEAQ